MVWSFQTAGKSHSFFNASYAWYKFLIGSIYELHKKIGKGGCGSVYKGRNPNTSKSIMSRSAKKEYLHLTIIFIPYLSNLNFCITLKVDFKTFFGIP